VWGSVRGFHPRLLILLPSGERQMVSALVAQPRTTGLNYADQRTRFQSPKEGFEMASSVRVGSPFKGTRIRCAIRLGAPGASLSAAVCHGNFTN